MRKREVGLMKNLNEKINLSTKLESMPENNLEIFKLDPIDRKVLFLDVLPNHSQSLLSYVEHIAQVYRESKGIEIDEIKLLKELLSSCYRPRKRIEHSGRWA
jgi:hypothetical protein